MSRVGWTRGRRSRHPLELHCETVREAVSARVDGEHPVVPSAVLDAHLARCAACRGFEAGVTGLARELRVREPKSAPAGLASSLTPLLRPVPPSRHAVSWHRPSRRRAAQWAMAALPAALAALVLPLGATSGPAHAPQRTHALCSTTLLQRSAPGRG